MLWRGIDLSTFDVETLRGWLDRLEDERSVIQAEIDRRPTEPAAKGRATALIKEIVSDPGSHYVVKGVGRMVKTDPPTGGLTEGERKRMWEIDPLNPRSTDRGAPPRRDEDEG